MSKQKQNNAKPTVLLVGFAGLYFQQFQSKVNIWSVSKSLNVYYVLDYALRKDIAAIVVGPKVINFFALKKLYDATMKEHSKIGLLVYNLNETKYPLVADFCDRGDEKITFINYRSGSFMDVIPWIKDHMPN